MPLRNAAIAAAAPHAAPLARIASHWDVMCNDATCSSLNAHCSAPAAQLPPFPWPPLTIPAPFTTRWHLARRNDTVANLSLMALGSSAPEIMLNVLDILLGDFFIGDLGPSTIVGSAAFNLMVISAVCVMAIPDGEGRYIQEQSVFMITAFFSIFAYVWLYFILGYSTYAPHARWRRWQQWQRWKQEQGQQQQQPRALVE